MSDNQQIIDAFSQLRENFDKLLIETTTKATDEANKQLKKFVLERCNAEIFRKNIHLRNKITEMNIDKHIVIGPNSFVIYTKRGFEITITTTFYNDEKLWTDPEYEPKYMHSVQIFIGDTKIFPNNENNGTIVDGFGVVDTIKKIIMIFM